MSAKKEDGLKRWQRYSTSEHGRAKNVAKAVEHNRQKRAWIAAFKVAQGCMDCGYDAHSEALEFDHRDGDKKLFAISRATVGMKKIMAEIEKCDVVCANCHRVRTARRRAETQY